MFTSIETYRKKSVATFCTANSLDICLADMIYMMSKENTKKSNDTRILAVRMSIAGARMIKSPTLIGPRRPQRCVSTDQTLFYDMVDHFIEQRQHKLKCSVCGIQTKYI